MTKQGKINDKQIRTNESQNIINEDTKFDIKFNNVWAIVISLVSMTFAIIMFIYRPQVELQNKLDLLNQKQETIIGNQKELTSEFRQWKSQAENRLGTVESRQNTVISYVEGHLQVSIK